MTRIKNGFTSLRINDLGGGLNLRDSEDQIQNKQMTRAINWTTFGNRLVNTKSAEVVYNVAGTTEVQSLLIDDDDIWFIHGDVLYKNGVAEVASRFVDVTSVLNATTYTVTLDGTPYTYLSDGSATEAEILAGLKSSIEVGGYTVTLDKTLKEDASVSVNGLFINNGVTAFTITVGANLALDVNTLLPADNRRYNMTIWNNLLFITSIDKDGTDNDKLFYYSNGVFAKKTLTTDDSIFNGGPVVNTVYNGKLILGGFSGQPNLVLHSKTGSATDPFLTLDFSAYNSGAAQVGNSSLVTGFSVGENGLYVFKTDEVHYSNSEKDTGSIFEFIYNKITTNGASAQGAIHKVEQEIFYYDGISRSVRRLGYEQNLTTLRDSAISNEIEPIFEQIANDQGYVTSSYKYPFYKLFLRSPLAGLNVNDICLTYNVREKSWCTEERKICSVATSGYFGSPFKGEIFRDDAGVGIDGDGILKQFDFGDGVDFKRFGELEIKGKMDDTQTLFVDIYIDGVLEETRTVNVAASSSGTLGSNVLGLSLLGGSETNNTYVSFRERFDLFYDGQYLDVGVRYDGLGDIEISSAAIQIKPLRGYITYV